MTGRVRALLRAVAAGRAEMTCSCEPDVYVDGLCFCDQYLAHQVAHQGLIRPAAPGPVGQRVRAVLTPTGRTALEVSA